MFIGDGLSDIGHEILHVCDKSGKGKSRVAFMSKDSLESGISILDRAFNFAWLFVRVRLFKPDVIYVHQLNNWMWVRLSRALPKVPRVYDAHTSVFYEHQNFGADEEGQQITFDREKSAVIESDLVITVSSETSKILSEIYNKPESKLHIVKNATQIIPIRKILSPKNERFICTSVLPIDGFPSNDMALEMLLDIAAEVESEDSSILFVVIGGGTKPLPKSGNVLYTGFIEDFEDEILKSDICLATYPDGAVCGGVRNKICDFLALGQAIVSTPEGMRGFDDCHPQVDYFKAINQAEFVSAILHLSKNREELEQFRINALSRGNTYQWSERAKEVESIFQSLNGVVADLLSSDQNNVAEPFFSIITPTYNRASFLGEMIVSVQAQTFSDYEHIIVDDGSEDNSEGLVKEYANEDQRIIYIKQQNKGRSIARNVGITAARGRFICFLDSDDLWLPDHLGTLRKAAVSLKQDTMLHTGLIWFYENGIKEHKVKYSDRNKFNSDVEYVIANQFAPDSVCVSRKILYKYQFNPALFINEDVELWARITSEFPVLPVSGYTAKLRVHSGNTDKQSRDSILHLIYVFSSLLNNPLVNEKLSVNFIRNKQRGLKELLIRHYQSTGQRTQLIRELLFFLIQFPEAPRNSAKLVTLIYNLPGGSLLKSLITSIKSLKG